LFQLPHHQPTSTSSISNSHPSWHPSHHHEPPSIHQTFSPRYQHFSQDQLSIHNKPSSLLTLSLSTFFHVLMSSDAPCTSFHYHSEFAVSFGITHLFPWVTGFVLQFTILILFRLSFISLNLVPSGDVLNLYLLFRLMKAWTGYWYQPIGCIAALVILQSVFRARPWCLSLQKQLNSTHQFSIYFQSRYGQDLILYL